MKTKLLTLALTAAGIAAVTVAQAQPAPAPTPTPAPTTTSDPNAPPPAAPGDPAAPAPTATTTSTAQPAPPPPGAPAQPAPGVGDPNAPPAPPAVAPAQQPPPVTQPPVQWTPPPAAPPAQPAPPPEEKKPGMTVLQRFAGSMIFWSHQASASIFGACPAQNTTDGFSGCIYGDSDVYTQSLTFAPSVFLYREGRHAVRASSIIQISTELTNADNTTLLYQPDVNNIPITVADTIQLAAWGAGGGANAAAVARDPTLAGAVEYRTQALTAGSLIFPTSRQFASGGLQFATSLSAGLRQQVKLFGSSSDYLPNIILIAREVWTHSFWKSKTPIDDDLSLPRQDYAGNALSDNQLRGGALAENRLTHDFRFQLPVYGDLQLSGLFQIINDFPYTFTDNPCDVQAQTGCVDLDKTNTKMRALSQFDVSLYYQVLPELGVDVGYNNFNTQLGENAKYRNPFASPSSSFYADIYLFPDQLINRIISPKPKTQVGRR